MKLSLRDTGRRAEARRRVEWLRGIARPIRVAAQRMRDSFKPYEETDALPVHFRPYLRTRGPRRVREPSGAMVRRHGLERGKL